MSTGTRLVGAAALVTVAAVACGGGTERAAPVPAPAPIAGAEAGPVVEVVPTTAAGPPLDPTAAPRTPLGELRARYLPVWSPGFDWAFPPETCGSDWALDAVAEPTSGANPAILGDFAAAAALSVMRYEHLVSRALAAPDALGQICVAVGSVGAARSEALDLLASYLATGTRSAEPPSHPDEVTIVAAGPTAVLAVMCTAHAGPAASGAGDESLDGAAPARLHAYLLTVARGLEDAVTDISYRVSEVTRRSADGCDGLDSWVADWQARAAAWAAGGEIWTTVDRSVSTEELCEDPPPGGPDECPEDWSP